MQDLYQTITDRIIAELETGSVPWVRPWKTSGRCQGMPHNLTTGKPYRGINTLLLGLQPYADQAWLTYKQAQDAGGHIKRGEHGSVIVFYKKLSVQDRADATKTKTIPLLRAYTVFNVAQCEGIQAAPTVEPVAAEPTDTNAAADALLAQATIQTGGDTACYIPSADIIRLPVRSAFNSTSDFYATALHELTHWTGHTSRLDRLRTMQRFGDDAYCREELIAEMGAAFLCGALGIPGKLQHASYIGHWIKVLRQDKRAVVTAAGSAQKAVDLIRGEAFEAALAA